MFYYFDQTFKSLSTELFGLVLQVCNPLDCIYAYIQYLYVKSLYLCVCVVCISFAFRLSILARLMANKYLIKEVRYVLNMLCSTGINVCSYMPIL